jgi:hypothetical protein
MAEKDKQAIANRIVRSLERDTPRMKAARAILARLLLRD